tara:strand:- start:5197 stop:6651 length:1455 start_codon:yes stop_codon:yes gene_type:complete
MPVSNSIIEQEPLYDQLPVGQEIIFVVSNQDAVANETKVKFCAEVHISPTLQPNTSVGTDLIGTFKTTPNNAGVGIFDLRSIVENYVKADNMAADGSQYKSTVTDADNRHPIHLIDWFSLNNNTVRYMALQFYVEYLGADDGVNTVDPNIVRRAAGTSANSNLFTLFNGYLKYTDELALFQGDFGYSLTDFFPDDNLSPSPAGSSKKFLTNAPKTQYANVNDYGTLALFQKNQTQSDAIYRMEFTYYDSGGNDIGSEFIGKGTTTGAYTVWDTEVNKQLLFFGCFPANLQNWSSTFQGLVSLGTILGGYYTIRFENAAGANTMSIYTIQVKCPDNKGYESIRLCWLNQWGAWDYYTFTKKSIKTISTKGSTYTQLQGTWNDSVYTVDSYKGGKKSFRVNSTEKIKMNTDFVSEDDNVMFEELINSPEVYLLNGFKTDNFTAFNTYVVPVRLTTSSFTRKTSVNDRLIQYTFEIEKTKTLRTQAV